MLPKEKTKKVLDPSRLMILIYGAPKIGKSTFASQFNEALFLETEPGLNAIEHYGVPINCFEDIDKVYNELIDDKKFKTIIIDTIDVLFEIVRKKALDKLGIENETEIKGNFGSGYQPINSLFKETMNKFFALNRMGKGLVLTSHSKININGKTVPSLPDTASRIISSAMDIVLYADVMTKENGEKVRIINTAPDSDFEAGDRTGMLPEKLLLKYDKFMSYFNKKGDTK